MFAFDSGVFGSGMGKAVNCSKQLNSSNNHFYIFIHDFCLFQPSALQNFVQYTGDRNHYNLCHNLRQFLAYEYFYHDIKSENSLS
jgi:hypothetical protein